MYAKTCVPRRGRILAGYVLWNPAFFAKMYYTVFRASSGPALTRIPCLKARDTRTRTPKSPGREGRAICPSSALHPASTSNAQKIEIPPGHIPAPVLTATRRQNRDRICDFNYLSNLSYGRAAYRFLRHGSLQNHRRQCISETEL